MAQFALEATQVTKPPVPIAKIAESYGLAVRYEPVESNLSGFLYRDEHEPVIGVNSRHSEVRQRFTIAHELGHFLLHRSAGLRVDREVIGRPTAGRGDQASAAEEVEANIFAATILMPAELLEKDMDAACTADLWFEQRHIAELARKYGVSVQALVLRLNDLGFIER